MAKRTQHRKPQSVSRRTEGLIAIRAKDDNQNLIEEVVTAQAKPTLARMAAEWGYILRVRTRWASDADIRDNFGIKAT
jgi:hypothetical protein